MDKFKVLTQEEANQALKESSLRNRERELIQKQQSTDELRAHLEMQRIETEKLRQDLENQKIEIDKKRQEVEEQFSHTRSSFLLRERDFENQINKRDKALNNREDLLKDRAIELDERVKNINRHLEEKEERQNSLFKEKLQEITELRQELDERAVNINQELNTRRINQEKYLSEKEEELKTQLASTENEKKRFQEEFQKKIEQTSKSFVKETLEELDTKVKDFQKSAGWWSKFGALTLVVGLIYFSYLTHQTSKNMPTEITWEFIIFSVLKGFIGISLLLVLARYAYQLSSHYMKESLRNADRRHAINFGKFYMQTYGVSADWPQVKEVFENWNISGSTGFSKDDSEKIDLATIEKATSLFEKAMKAAPTLFGKTDKEKS